MAADFIDINRSKPQGNKTVRLAELLQEATNLCGDLKVNADHQWDTGQFGKLETNFGTPAGSGANFLALLGGVQTALGTAPIPEFIARVANQ